MIKEPSGCKAATTIDEAPLVSATLVFTSASPGSSWAMPDSQPWGMGGMVERPWEGWTHLPFLLRTATPAPTRCLPRAITPPGNLTAKED